MKQSLKRMVRLFCLAMVAPLFALHRLLSLVADRDSSFQSFSQFFSLIPGKPGIYLRAAFYRLACPDTSDDISIGFLTVFSHWDTTIGKGVYIGPQCNIGKCIIGESTLLGSGVHVLSGSKQHNFDDPTRPIQEQGGTFTKTRIGRDCWLGNASVVMNNVGNHSIVAAGSVVSQIVESGFIVAGNPAKVIRPRFPAPSPSASSQHETVHEQ
ncbi:MAG TPA: acyltransferase [Marinobacter sp.]|uniref:acyltransferase n=1 Tax=Marinobacter sp. TaxID=50741 RepID=UPI002D7FCC02|nr:acyltransferase [Marinobacter sp.]HET8800072.1 acyltransferase [Marinobacter sp.]